MITTYKKLFTNEVYRSGQGNKKLLLLCTALTSSDHTKILGLVFPCTDMVTRSIMNRKNIGRHALFSYIALYDVIEFSNCHTEEGREAEFFCAV